MRRTFHERQAEFAITAAKSDLSDSAQLEQITPGSVACALELSMP
jgi:hypothetical protein